MPMLACTVSPSLLLPLGGKVFSIWETSVSVLGRFPSGCEVLPVSSSVGI
jgi:hypothetical protein